MKIAVIVNFDKKGAVLTASEITRLLIEEGAEVYTLKSGFSHILHSTQEFDTHSELVSACDVLLTVGGDGTIIHCAKHAAAYSKPILGINTGRLGYVAELEADEIDMLKSLLNGEYSLENRLILSVIVNREDGCSECYTAINDAVISRGVLSRIIDLDVKIDGSPASSYRADGVLIATPTGSTAYALSAGGPIIAPNLKCFELVPICSHALSARCVMLSADSTVEIKANSPDGKSYLTIDGQISVELSENDIVEVKSSEQTLNMILLKKRNFFKLAGEKLREVNVNEA
ncbi:MAG: NAD(+)/NADH kinase [Clostridia bacterium]|nr:NAD(+)/NADH kinase [Clostridia bacterium]